MKEKQAFCKFKHPPSMTCPYCAPPEVPNYQGKKDCNKGHKPWPEGVCLSCAPPIANIKEQSFRYCDSISLQAELVQPWYFSWVRKGTDKQRAAILFGKYLPEPEETKNQGAIRAQVYALYEPPQEGLATGVRFLRDPDEKTVHEVAERLGIEPVGWIITTMPRSGEKYGGKVFMSGAEVLQAARFQNRYKNDIGHSRFVTVVIEYDKTAVEPRAYQVSDQCVAMERDGLIIKAEDPYMISTREQKNGEMPPAVVYKAKSLLPGTPFLPDDFLVKVIVSQAKAPESKAKKPTTTATESKDKKDDKAGAGTELVLHHSVFPSRGTDLHMRSHMAEQTRQPYEQKLADFNLLVYLSKTIGWPLTQQICDAIRDKKGLSKDQREALDRALVAKQLL